MRRPHFPRDDRPFDLEEYAPPGFLRLWVRVLGIAALLGFLAGVFWILAHLVFGYRFGGN